MELKFCTEHIPATLRSIDQWVCWSLVPDATGNKPRKIPLNPNTLDHARTNDRTTWGTFELAAQRAQENGIGIGFVFSDEDDLFGFDYDGCRVNGVVNAEAVKIMRDLGTYGEISQSGGGIHSIGRGRIPGAARRKGPYEIYESKRFFVVTGAHCAWCPADIVACQEGLNKVYQRIWGKPGTTSSPPPTPASEFRINAEPSLNILLFEALCENEPKFKRSWDRTRRDLADQSASSYDLSLARIAARAGWTDQQIVDLLVLSRQKHGDGIKSNSNGVPREDYYARTLVKAKMEDEVIVNSIDMGLSSEDGGPAERENVLESLSNALGLPMDKHIRRIIRAGGDPAIYHVEFADRSSARLGGIGSLTAQGVFNNFLADVTGVIPKKLNANQWRACAQAMLKAREELDIGSDGDIALTVLEELRLYFEANPPPRDRDEAMLAAIHHRPFYLWEDNATACFSSRGFLQYYGCFGASKSKLDKQDLARILRSAGCTKRVITFRNEGKAIHRKVWTNPGNNDTSKE